MRPPQDLLELPYSFTQLPLLTPDEFLRAAVDRGLHATRDDLQALHRLRLLVPMFRVRRDGRAVARAARRHAAWGRQAGGSHPTTDLREQARGIQRFAFVAVLASGVRQRADLTFAGVSWRRKRAPARVTPAVEPSSLFGVVLTRAHPDGLDSQWLRAVGDGDK